MKSILTPVFQDNRNSFSKVVKSCLFCGPLAIGAGDLRAVRYVPLIVSLNNGCELISHLARDMV